MGTTQTCRAQDRAQEAMRRTRMHTRGERIIAFRLLLLWNVLARDARGKQAGAEAGLIVSAGG